MNSRYQPPVVPQPQVQTPTHSQDPNNPYGFIMDASMQPKVSRLPNQNSMKSRLLLVFGLGAVVLMVGIIGYSLIFGSRTSNSELLISLAAEQQEIIRITELGIASTTNIDTLAVAETTRLSITSQRASLLSYLKKNNVVPDPVLLKSKQDKKTDLAFTEASANNNFDAIYLTKIKQEMTLYASNLKINYEKASNEESKKLLKTSFDSTTALIK